MKILILVFVVLYEKDLFYFYLLCPEMTFHCFGLVLLELDFMNYIQGHIFLTLNNKKNFQIHLKPIFLGFE